MPVTDSVPGYPVSLKYILELLKTIEYVVNTGPDLDDDQKEMLLHSLRATYRRIADLKG